MTDPLLPCPACARHVHPGTSHCPFCNASLAGVALPTSPGYGHPADAPSRAESTLYGMPALNPRDLYPTAPAYGMAPGRRSPNIALFVGIAAGLLLVIVLAVFFLVRSRS